MSLIHILLAVLVSLLWGINFTAAKIALVHFPVLFLLSIRLFIVALLIYPFSKPLPISWKNLWLLAFTTAIFNTGLGYMALQLGLHASIAAVIDQLRVPFAVMLSAYLLKETFHWRTGLGIIIAFIGTFIIVSAHENGSHLAGAACSLVSAFGWAVYNLQIKKLGKIDVLSLLGMVSFLGSLQLFLCSLLFETSISHLGLLLSISWPQALAALVPTPQRGLPREKSAGRLQPVRGCL